MKRPIPALLPHDLANPLAQEIIALQYQCKALQKNQRKRHKYAQKKFQIQMQRARYRDWLITCLILIFLASVTGILWHFFAVSLCVCSSEIPPAT
jgi:uncharacterized membrane protein